MKFLLSTVSIMGLALSAHSASELADSGENLIDQWVQTEKSIVTEKVDWQERQAHTQQLTKLYEKELLLLEEELSKAGKNAGFVDEEAEVLKQSIKDSEKARLLAIDYLAQIKPRVLSLYQRLPHPLQQQLEDQHFILQNEVNNATVQDSLRATVKILQESARFDRSFVFEEHAIELNGETLRAKVMYLGLSCAFFQAGESFGKAIPSESGWVFTEESQLQKEITKAFAIQEKAVPSAFFKLPLQLRKEQP